MKKTDSQMKREDMERKCDRCRKDITAIKDYGGYVVDKGKNLCVICFDKWIVMRKDHYYQEETFLTGGKIV